MKLIPVIDLLDGQVVHAIAGERSRYRPFEDSRYAFDRPYQLVEKMIQDYSPEYFYVADLNAIQQHGNNLDVIQQFSSLDVRFVIDLGITEISHVAALQSEIGQAFDWIPVFGTESLDSITEFGRALKENNPAMLRDCFLSLDLKGGKLLGDSAESRQPLDCLQELIAHGFRNIIDLDLARVGRTDGELFEWIPKGVFDTPSLNLYRGGGVHSKADLVRLQQVGYAGVLAATALHRGDILPDDVMKDGPTPSETNQIG